MIYLQWGHPWRPGQTRWATYRIYLLLFLELAGLIVLNQSAATDWSSIIFVIYTATVMLNYPAMISFPVIVVGYSLYAANG